ncbi:hypothetical protein BDR26DRAFT_207012 [Obelidium mucronatum]|nr:hypothetical protein BDR26DRAFT_207012 [Obelidium mucronatum]
MNKKAMHDTSKPLLCADAGAAPSFAKPRRSVRRRLVLLACAVLCCGLVAAALAAGGVAAACRRSKPHRSHKCRALLRLFGDADSDSDSRAVEVDVDPLRLSLSGLYVEAPSHLAVHFDSLIVDPATIQLHFKLKSKDSKPPKVFAKNPDFSRSHDGSDAVHDMHEFKKCAPESLLDNVAFFSTKCVDFKADYKAASMGKKLTYKFKVLAKKMHHKTSEFDADFGAVVDGGNDLVLMGSDADSSENEFKQISSDRKITKELSKKWSERWNVLKKKSASPKSKFIFVEQDVVVIKRPLVPWPFANDDGVWPPSSPNTVGSVAHNLQTYGKPYIHGGFDIRTSSNASCHSPVAGRIVKIVKYQESDLYYSVMVSDRTQHPSVSC